MYSPAQLEAFTEANALVKHYREQSGLLPVKILISKEFAERLTGRIDPEKVKISVAEIPMEIHPRLLASQFAALPPLA